MKLPSIAKLTESVATVLNRFPFEMFFVLSGCIAATAYTELESIKRVAESRCLRVMMIANLGLLISLAVTLYTESKKIPPVKALAFKFLAALFAITLIFIINPFEREADRTRFFLISLSFHLLVAFAAFTSKGQVQGFWQFNKALFLRFLTGALYSVVLYAGIAAALAAMNFLFNFKFEWDTFAILWIWIAGMFNTLFFLAGVPNHLQALDEDGSYPKWLKVFTQYVLIPLATLYVAILLAYELKILVQWNLPKGLVSDMILGYAVFGILSILLVYPVRDQQENKWLKTYARSFYFLMLPLIVLLLLAVGTRVFRYGITEWRYFLIVLAIWLTFITVYYLVSKKQNIKLIPISLCILTLLAVYGPQSAFSVSMYSQQRILIHIFENNDAFKSGKLMPVDSNKISIKEGNKAVATLDYLITHHDLASLAPYLSVNLNKISDSLGKQHGRYNEDFEVSKYELRGNKLAWVKKYLHLNRFSEYGDRYAGIDTVSEVNGSFFFLDKNDVFKVKGYDYLIDKQSFEDGSSTYVVDGLSISQHNIEHAIYDITIGTETLSFDLKSKIDALDPKQLNAHKSKTGIHGSYNLPVGLLDITRQSKSYQVLFKVASVNFTRNAKGRVQQINMVNASYLIKVK